jgi:hypothetical protein
MRMTTDSVVAVYSCEVKAETLASLLLMLWIATRWYFGVFVRLTEWYVDIYTRWYLAREMGGPCSTNGGEEERV